MTQESAWDRLVAAFDYPMFVLTAQVDGDRAGCLVGFATQCSIDPPRFAIWVSDKNHTFEIATKAEHVAVHLVDHDLAELFGTNTGDEVDKFARCDWHDGEHGVPLLDGATGGFIGRVIDDIPVAGDHLGLLLEPVDSWLADEPAHHVRFQDVKDLDPGHEA